MPDEPPSRPVEVEILRAFLNSRNEFDFAKKVTPALESFAFLMEDLTEVIGKSPEVIPVEKWSDIPDGNGRFWLPLSEVDARRGVHYVYAPAVRDVIKSPKFGPFYIVSWELLIGTVLTSLREKAPRGPTGTLLGGAIASLVLVFNGTENELSASEYLDKLQSTASALFPEALKEEEWTNGTAEDFYLRAAYQFTFDALSLWTAMAMKRIVTGILDERSVARNVVSFLLQSPETNIGAFHAKGTEISKTLDCKRGDELTAMAYRIADAILTASSYPRVDDSDGWRMFC